jgi:hypothetical protein
MNVPQPVSPGEIRPERPRGGSRFITLSSAALAFILLAALHPEPIKAAWAEFERIIQLKSTPLPASPARISDHETDELANMEPQQQAQRLLERAVNHYEGAIELVAQRVDGWYGQINLDPQLNGLITTALNSNDLRVRAAAIEIDLSVYNLPKTPDTALALIDRAQSDSHGRPWALWMLGALGNRGVEAGRIQNFLLDQLKDPDEHTRYWAVEGLALLGTDATISPLLDVFHNDASMKVRERAACSLAQSGMLTKDQRMTAVPDFLRFTDDAALDPTTRSWAFQALRDITGQSLGNDPAAWRSWWANHPRG